MTEYNEQRVKEAIASGATNAIMAEMLGVSDRTMRRWKAKLASVGFAPANDMTRQCPDGFRVKGVSSLYNKDGILSAQWIKTTTDDERRLALLMETVEALKEEIPAVHAVVPPIAKNERLLNVYTISDYHFGMLAWKPETGDDWDTDDPKGTITGILTKENFQELGKTYTSRLEIYRPNPSIQVSTASYNNVFYETGDEYEIFNHGEPNARHGNTQYGQVVDGATAQTLDVNNNVLTPAELILNFGDVYIRNRAGYLPSIAPPVLDVQYIEDINYTDFFTSSGMDMGRVTAKIDSEQKTLNSIVRGEQFLEGTETNWLNVFILGTKSFDASDLYGPITGIEEMGGTLKVIQEHKEGSITIGEVTAKFADVGEFTYIGDAVFGAYRRYHEDMGTKYRRSMEQNNR